MKASEVICLDRIKLVKQLPSKKETLELMADMFIKDHSVQDRSLFLADIEKREKEFCTYVGHETAIPHAISRSVKQAGIAFVRSEKALPYGEVGEDVRLFFMLAIPEYSNTEHLRMLSMLAARLMHQEFREQLLHAETREEIYVLLKNLY